MLSRSNSEGAVSICSASSDGRTSDNVKVCVRLRPLPEERDGPETCVVCESMCSDKLRLLAAESRRRNSNNANGAMDYHFDWVLSSEASQETVYELLGARIVDGVADGFHGCVFAYGQTGSGKSYTIFGGGNEDRGLLPRLTEGLFSQLEGNVQYIVQLSYLEIYNEKIRDLLHPNSSDKEPHGSLEVRQHPKFGVFIPGLTSNVVHSPLEVANLLSYGHKIRVVGSTNMNVVSSRSHAVVSLNVDSVSSDPQRLRRRAQLHAVDLAGSERMSQAGDQEVRKTESKQINKSLLALSLMISKLAESQQSSKNTADHHAHIPYRNSKLTYILSDALMGNCRTVMVACASPALSCFTMTDSTMRFASSVKKIRTRPVKNVSVDGDLVNALRAEIQQLKSQLDAVGPQKTQEVEQRIDEQSSMLEMLQTTPAELKQKALKFEEQRMQTLGNLGLSPKHLGLSPSSRALACKAGASMTNAIDRDANPYLVNVCDDPLLAGCLTYELPCGEEVSVGCDPSCTVQIDGYGVRRFMCTLVNKDGQHVEVVLRSQTEEFPDSPHGKRHAISFGGHDSMDEASSPGRSFQKGISRVFVDNSQIKGNVYMKHGQRLRIGRTHVFQLYIPTFQTQEYKRHESLLDIAHSLTFMDTSEHYFAKEYAEQLKQRIGRERAVRVFQRIEKFQSLIDEANELSDEIRGGEDYEFVFKLKLITDITSVDEDPEILIVLNKMEKPDEISFGGTLRFNDNDRKVFTQYWPTQKFEERLDLLRDLHNEMSDREGSWDEEVDIDPWREDVADVVPAATLKAFEEKLKKAEAALIDKDANLTKLRKERDELRARCFSHDRSPRSPRRVAVDSADVKGIPSVAAVMDPVQKHASTLRLQLHSGIERYREQLQALDNICDIPVVR